MIVAVILASVVLGVPVAPQAGAAVGARVKAKDNFFQPQRVVIQVGEKVKWTNVGENDHTVTGSGFSERLTPGEVFRHRFNAMGVFRYRCRIHDGMKGKVVVQ